MAKLDYDTEGNVWTNEDIYKKDYDDGYKEFQCLFHGINGCSSMICIKCPFLEHCIEESNVVENGY